MRFFKTDKVLSYPNNHYGTKNIGLGKDLTGLNKLVLTNLKYLNYMYQLIDTHTIKGNLFSFFFCLLLTVTLISCDSSDENTVGPDPDAPSVSELMQDDGELSVLVQLINQSGLNADLEAEGSFTVFAPTDSVLESQNLNNLSDEQLKSILSYHVVPSNLVSDDILNGEKSFQTVQGDSIFSSDRSGDTRINNKAHIQGSQQGNNGNVHKIDELLLPDSGHNVFEIINKRYYTHKFACSCTSGRTGLTATLANESNDYTIFVPSDVAFENYGNVDDLSDEELKPILEYHIVEGELLSSDLSEGQELTTLNGEQITITSVSAEGAITINGEATVQLSDLQGTNGVVHVLDKLIVPPHDDM